MEFKVEQYFRIISTQSRILHVELIGFWNDDIVHKLGESMVEKWKLAVDQFYGENFFILVDMSLFKGSSFKAKKYIKQTMEYSFGKGFVKAFEIAPKDIIKERINEIAASTEVNEYRVQASNVTEALKLLDDLKRHLI
jgi:uncharacterized protein (DUF433 family)